VPLVSAQQLRSRIVAEVAAGGRIAALFGVDAADFGGAAAASAPAAQPAPVSACGGQASGPRTVVVAVVARDRTHEILVVAADMGSAYPSLTPVCPEAHWFERELWEQWGVVPEGHPQLKPIRFEPSWRGGEAAGSGAKGHGNAAPTPGRPQIGVTEFFRLHGAEVHEVAVGPVHAGVIEPGHFRFQCWGETVYHLEISLGYQHRGVERIMRGGPDKRSPHLAETLAGDTTIGHATAYSGMVEALCGCRVPERAQALRALALELERMANHIGDLGALAGDVGYLPTASYCGRIRGDVLNMTALLCGSRFGRSLVRPGGTLFDLGPAMAAELETRLDAVLREARSACDLLWKTPAVRARFEGTGTVDNEWADEIGMVGPAARASGLSRDTRRDHPWGWYRDNITAPAVETTGDVWARARVRWREVEASAAIVRRTLQAIPDMAPSDPAPVAPTTGHALAVCLTEGWRGEICHVALTGEDGRFSRYKVVDPSFHNWFGLACALRGQQISDFPLCNKSFNLSYCGHDL
jgi:Ni,Fe-hydrogenase III large subunit